MGSAEAPNPPTRAPSWSSGSDAHPAAMQLYREAAGTDWGAMTSSMVDSGDEQESVARAADYVGAVLRAVDELPVFFTQRRSRSWFGRLTMPGNRQLTQMFVRRQLTVTLGRLKSETGLNETAATGQSRVAGQLNVLVEAAGAKSSTVVPVLVVLGVIALMVSLLSIGAPSLQGEADLLGSFPRVVTLDGAAVADSATAFDKNPSVFSPADLTGVIRALLLGSIVAWGLFSVLAGSAHAAASILDDPWRYAPSAPFKPAVRRGPVPTQRAAFGTRPRRIHTPVGADLVRDAALYTILAAAYLLALAVMYAKDGDSPLFDYWRVSAASAFWLSVLVVFPLGILGTYLVIRHRRAGNGSALAPPKGWRVGLGTLLAAATCFFLVGGSTFFLNARLTASADLAVQRNWNFAEDGNVVANDGSLEVGEDEFREDLYFTVGGLDSFKKVRGVQTQSISYYDAVVEVPDGLIYSDLLVTELDSAEEFLGADLDDETLGQLRSTSKSADSDEDSAPIVWISNGLATSLDPAQGDEIVLLIDADEEQRLTARASRVFVTPGSDDPVIVLDVADFPDELLIDEILLRSTDGPLRDDSESMGAIKDVVAQIGDGENVINAEILDLRSEFAKSTKLGVIYLVLFPLLAFAAIVAAFGRPWKWSGVVNKPAAPATAPGAATAAGAHTDGQAEP